MTPAARPRVRAVSRLLERLLILIGVVTLGYYAWASVEASVYQAYENRELNAILAAGPPVETLPGERTAPVLRAMPAAGSIIGRLEIPRLDVTAVVRAGSDARTLQLAVGHVPGTALPGEVGNIGLAAHRDTFFRRLGDVWADDIVRLVTPDGTFEYRVERTHVVQPSDVWVLDATAEPTLTLVTCYPFSYIGTAPERFIVRARLVKTAAASG